MFSLKTHKDTDVKPLDIRPLIPAANNIFPNPCLAKSGFIYNEKRWPQELSSLSGPTPKNPTNCPSSKPRYMSFCESGKNAFSHNSVALSLFMASRTIWLKMSLYEMCQHLKNTETIAGISATSALTIFTDQRLPYAKITYE